MMGNKLKMTSISILYSVILILVLANICQFQDYLRNSYFLFNWRKIFKCGRRRKIHL
jgi:hypothetical protein